MSLTVILKSPPFHITFYFRGIFCFLVRYSVSEIPNLLFQNYPLCHNSAEFEEPTYGSKWVLFRLLVPVWNFATMFFVFVFSFSSRFFPFPLNFHLITFPRGAGAMQHKSIIYYYYCCERAHFVLENMSDQKPLASCVRMACTITINFLPTWCTTERNESDKRLNWINSRLTFCMRG